MQSADLPKGDDLALRRRLHLAWRRRVAVQRQVRPGIVIVVEVIPKDSVEMPFVEHDQVVETFPTYRADDSLAVGILPGRTCRGRDLVDAHGLDPLLEVIAIDVVPVA